MDPSEREIRLRCIEAAARNPVPHPEGYGAAVLEAAKGWAEWVVGPGGSKSTLSLPKK